MLENIDQTQLLLASGKQVLQKSSCLRPLPKKFTAPFLDLSNSSRYRVPSFFNIGKNLLDFSSGDKSDCFFLDYI